MESSYSMKNDTVQRAANNSAAAILDNSAQGMSLQRKADLADGAIQRETDEEEEPIQGKFIQREALPEEEELPG